jgi:hypothetical protein
MAKKSRRSRRQQTARRPSTPPPAETTESPQPSDTPDKELAAAAASAPRQEVDFRAEYRYVIDDLRSMAIIAVAMLAVLISLSLVIR